MIAQRGFVGCFFTVAQLANYVSVEAVEEQAFVLVDLI